MTAEETIERLIRLREEPRYAVENLYEVLDARKRILVPFRFNECQVEFENLRTWFVERDLPIRITAVKARRVGVSSVVEAYIYQDTTTHKNTKSLIVGNEKKPSANVLQMCHRFWKSTPDEYRPPLPPSYRGHLPSDRMEFPTISSEMYIATSRSVDAYLGFGFNNIHATEVAYYDDGFGLFRALSPTVPKEPGTMLVLESTPNGMSGKGEFFYNQSLESARNSKLSKDDEKIEPGMFLLFFVPWWKMNRSFKLDFKSDERRRRFIFSLTNREKELIHRFHVSLEQLLWRRAMLHDPTFNNDEEYFMQEYPEDLVTAFLSTGSAVFRRADIRRLMADVRDPIWKGDIYWGKSDASNRNDRVYDTVRRPKFLTRGEALASGFGSHVNGGTFNNLYVWAWPEKDDRLFICGDVAKGEEHSRDGDDSAIVVGRHNDWGRDEVIMRWKGKLNPMPFAEVACALSFACLYRVGENQTAPELAIEWQGPGILTNTYIDRHRLYPHTYWYIQPSVRGQKKTKHIGWESNYKVKQQMVGSMQRYVEADLIDIPDEETVKQMAAYEVHGKGTMDEEYGGRPGVHDDLVTATQIFCVRSWQEAGRGGVTAISERGESDDPGDEPWDPLLASTPDDLEEETSGDIVTAGYSEPLDEETLFWTDED